MAALSQNSTFQSLVDAADQKITNALTEAGQTGKLEISITYTATTGTAGIVVNRVFQSVESFLDSGVRDVSA